MLACNDAVAELKVTLKDLFKEDFDNTITKWEGRIQSLQHTAETIESGIERRTEEAGSSRHYNKSINASKSNITDYKKLVSNDEKELKKLEQERKELQNLLDQAEKNGISKNSEAYHEMQASIYDVENSMDELRSHTVDCYNKMAEETVNIFETTVTKFDERLNKLQHDQEHTSSLIDRRTTKASEYRNMKMSRESAEQNIVDYQSILSNNRDQRLVMEEKRNELERQLNQALKKGPKNGGIVKGSEDYYKMLSEIQAVDKDIDDLNIDYWEAWNDAAAQYKNIFDSIASEYENKLSLLEHESNEINNAMDQAEAKGRLGSEKYYEDLRDIETQNIEAMKKELSDLQTALDNGLASGKIKQGSEAWYDMRGKINGVTENIQKAETEVIKFGNEIRQIKWDNFDYLEDRISRITDEADFLVDLMSDEKMVEDNGRFTSEGTASVGLHAVNYDVYMRQADDYAEKIEEINKEIAEDPANKDLIARKEELIDAQQESILAANQEKQAMKDLVKEGIDAAINSMSELISKYEDAIDRQRDLYSYQQDIENQAKNISALQKQLSAYEGDLSEETKAKVQQIKVQLEEAQQDLKDSEYDHYIDEQKKLLDDLQTEYEETLNKRLDNIDALISDMITYTNQNADNIQKKLEEVTGAVGYNMTKEMKGIWDLESAKIDGVNSVVSLYKEDFDTTMSTTNTTLDQVSTNTLGVGENISSMKQTAEAEAVNAATQRETEQKAREDAETAAQERAKAISDKIGGVDTSVGGVKNSVDSVKGSVDATKNSVDSVKNAIDGMSGNLSNLVGKDATTVFNEAFGGQTVTPELKEITGGIPIGGATGYAKGTKNIAGIINSGAKRSKTLTKDEQQQHHDLWKYLVKTFGITPTVTMYKELAKALGVSVSNVPTSDEKDNILKKLHAKGYASGLRKAKRDEMAWVNEKGQEIILRPTDNAALVDINQGDAVIDAKATENLWKMANDPASFINRYSIGEVAVKDTSGVSSGSGGSTINMGDYAFTVNLPNVTNYEQFRAQLMKDRMMEKYICAVTIDPMLGKNKSAKYKLNP